MPQPDMSGKVCMVTGANAGIGNVTAHALAEMGATVVMVCRNSAKGEAALDEIKRKTGTEDVHLMLADLGSQAQTRALADCFNQQFGRLDVLVNNAGLILGKRRLTEDGIETTFAVNHLGYFLLTHLLLDQLKAAAPARIVNVASDAHRIGPLPFDNLQGEQRYDGMRVYGVSKLANIMFTYELARRLGGTGVTANCLHPGVVATSFGSEGTFLVKHFFRFAKPFILSPEKGAETQIYLATSPEVGGVSGQYFVKKKAVRSSSASYDEAAWERLWKISVELTGIKEAQ